jgi:hypothetical protein
MHEGEAAMYLPIWAVVLLGVGWLGFIWLLIRRDGGGDLTQAPRMTLASATPQFALPPLPGPDGIPPEAVVELRAMLAQNQKIHAIKRLREMTGCGLAEAKDWVERL